MTDNNKEKDYIQDVFIDFLSKTIFEHFKMILMINNM